MPCFLWSCLYPSWYSLMVTVLGPSNLARAITVSSFIRVPRLKRRAQENFVILQHGSYLAMNKTTSKIKKQADSVSFLIH
ncbi:hypothetical protein BD408DRAFT_423766 [Parasitella parasitica]|nr:hypothetical protein BD408DRAFT_423766 [Parasitella parasitica]